MPLPPPVTAMLDRLTQAHDEIQQRICPLVAADTNAKYQASYLLSRIEDIKLIVERLGTQNDRMVILAHREDRLMPKVRQPTAFSKKLQAVMQERNRLVAKMRIDMESLYIYGNLALDYWASIVKYVYGLPNDSAWRFPYNALHEQIVKPTPPAALQPLISAHELDMHWLNYNLRIYRNGFIEHIDRPIQRGASAPNFYLGFSIHIPSAVGALSDAEKADIYASIAHIAPQFTSGRPANYWQRQPALTLQWMFHGIDQIANHSDRELVSKAWRELGGETVSYEIIVQRLTNLLLSSASTMAP